MMKLEEIRDSGKLGLITGYKPNRISLYIMLLVAGRSETLMELLYNDMEKYKIDAITQEDINL